MKYLVIEQHYGDQQYYAGDTREVKHKPDAERLIDMGLIEPIKAKAAPKAKNKMAQGNSNKAT